jgi:hypothetical protein
MKWSLYDDLIRRATQDASALLAARKEWEARTGTVGPDHDLYAERSDAFVEWFLIERRDESGHTPVEQALRAHHGEAASGGADAAFASLLVALRSSQRSLFRVVRLRPGGLLLDDLLGGARFAVEERRSLPGVLPGDVFEARLIPDPDALGRLVLGRAVLFHPREATAVLTQRASLARAGLAAACRVDENPRTSFLEQLLRLRLRALTYRHVSPARIYGLSDDSLRLPTRPSART